MTDAAPAVAFDGEILPGRVWECGLELGPGLEWEEWVEVGRHLGAVAKATKWGVGDWLLYGEATYGERYAQAADVTGYAPRSLQEMQRVAERFPPGLREASLSWAVHREFAALEEGERFGALRRAVEAGWTVAEAVEERRRLAPPVPSGTDVTTEPEAAGDRGEATRAPEPGAHETAVRADDAEPAASFYASTALASTSGEWLTPAYVLSFVVELLGDVDLDPCADPDLTVPATRHLFEADDGLAHAWHGRVYLNPPYGATLDRWVAKFLEEFEAGRMEAGLALLPARTDTGWHRRLRELPRCLVVGRLTFGRSAGSRVEPAPFPSMLVYAGPQEAEFVRLCERSKLGDVYVLHPTHHHEARIP